MNRKPFILVMLTALLGALVLSACAASSMGAPDSYSPLPEKAGEEGVSVDGGSSRNFTGAEAPVEAPGAGNPAVERIVIKQATLAISVESPEDSLQRISAMAEEMGGFVVSANMYQTYRSDGTEIPTASVVIRVPAERLNEAISRIKTETDQPVRNEKISSEDVTFQYTDLQSRLRNLQAAEEQLQEIMDNAQKTEDVLSVYSQLVSIREQIEVIKGQIKYYEQSAALSSVSVELIANAANQPIQVGGWQPQGTARDAIQVLIYAFQAMVDFLIYFVLLILPVLAAIVIPIWLFIALVRRWRRGKRKPTSA